MGVLCALIRETILHVWCVVAGFGRLLAVEVPAGSVWRRLATELGEVEVGSSLVAVGHALSELALRPVAVEDDAINCNGDDLDDDFDDAADESPVLEAAGESVVDFVTKDLRAKIVVAGPSPHVLAVIVIL